MSRLLSYLLIATALLSFSHATPITSNNTDLDTHTFDKRNICATFGPGSISVPGGSGPWLTCNPGSFDWVFQASDANFVM